MTKNTFAGFKYKDLLTGEILTVKKVDQEGIHFEESNLVVTDLTTFEEVETTLDGTKVGEFSLKNGILYYEDSKIECGTLAIEEIVATFKNKVILKVKSLNKKSSVIPQGKYELFVYNVVHDKFFKTQESFDELSVLHDEDGLLLLNGKTLVEHTISKEAFEELENSTGDAVVSEQLFSGDVKVGVVQQSLIAFRYGIYDSSFTYSGELKDVNVYKEGDDVVLTGLSDEVVKLYNVDGDDVSATVKGRLKVMQIICKPIFDEYLDSDEKGDIQEIEFDSFEINIIEDDEVKEVKPTHDGRHSLLIITENGFIYSNANYNPRYALGQTAKDVVDNYPFFVGLEPGTHRNVFTLSNENREIVKVEVVKTHDRGYTTNVIN